MDYLENRTFDEIQLGDSASLSRTLTQEDIQVFAIMSGDINPAHVDVEFAKSDMFHQVIGHGMWGAALISTVLGTELPGPGTIYISQTLRFKKPVAIGDVLKVTVTAAEKKSEKNRILFSCECRNQKDEVVIEGQAEVIAPTKKIRRAKIEMPEILLRRQYSMFEPYLAKAKQYKPLRAAVINPKHEKILLAVKEAEAAGYIKPIIINMENSHAAIQHAILMARHNEIDLIIRGGATREDLLHALLKPDKGILINSCLSYVAVVDVPTYPKALILTDTLVNIEPSLEVKRCITQNAINFAHKIGIKEPKVALIAGSDVVSNAMRSTVDAAALCKMAERGQIHGGIIDGPLTFDNVMSVEVAKDKGIESPVIGDADILVVPNVETGSILLKQLEYLAESHNTGLIIGGRVPVLMSHINDIHLSTVSCALAILEKSHD